MTTILVDFRQQGLDPLQQGIDRLVKDFQRLRREGERQGTTNLTKILQAQTRAAIEQAKATREQAKAEQEKQKTARQSAKLAQEQTRVDLARAKAQTEQAKTTREQAKAEQERLKVQQQQQRVLQEQSRAEQAAQRVLTEQARSVTAAAQAERELARARGETVVQTRTAAQRLQEYTDANLALGRSLQLPLSSVKQLTRELGLTPQTAQRVTARFRELQAAGAGSAQTFKVLSRELGISRNQFRTLETRLGASTQQLQNLAQVSRAASRLIIAGFASAGSTFVDFQRDIQGAAVRAGETLTAFEGVREEALRLGAETSKTATDVAATADQLSRMGFTAQDTEAALGGLVQASEGAGESLGRTTEVVGRALNQFGLAADQTGNVADLLVTAANSGDVSINTLGESLKFAGTVANSANQSLEDTVFLLTLAGNAGLRGGQAGRNFVSFLSRLDAASAASNTQLQGLARGSERAAEALQVIGTSVRDETTGQLRSLREILPQLQTDLRNLREQSPGDFGIVTRALFGTQGQRFANAIITATDEDLAQLEERFGNLEGAALRSSRALQQGLPGALTQLSSAAEGLRLALFEQFAGGAEAIVRGATELIRVFQSLPAPIQAFLAQASGFAAVLAIAVGALASFQLALKTLEPIQTANAAISAVQTARTAALDIATRAAAAAQSIFAVNTKTATTAQREQVAALTQGALRAGLFAGALASISLAVGTFQELTGVTRDVEFGIEQVDAAYRNLLQTQEQVARESRDVLDARELESYTRNLRALQGNLSGVQRLLDLIRTPLAFISQGINNILETLINIAPIPDFLRTRFLRFLDVFPQIATQAEAAANRQSAAFAEVEDQAELALDQYEEYIRRLEAGEEIDPRELAALQEFLTNSIVSTEDYTAVTEAASVAQGQLVTQLRAAKDELNQYSDAADGAGASAGDFADQASAAVDGLTESNRAALAEIERDTARANAQLAEDTAASATDRAEQEAEIERDSLQRRLEQAEAYFQSLRELAAEDPGNTDLQDQVIAAETDFYNAREALAQQNAEEQEAIAKATADAEKEAQEEIQETIRETQAVISRAAAEREQGLLQLERSLRASGNSEESIRERVAAETLEIERQNIQDRINAQDEAVRLFTAGTQERADAEVALAELQNDLLANQIAREEAAREAEIKAIEDQIAAEERRQESALNTADLQVAAIQRVENSLNRQTTLLNQQVQLEEAISNLRTASSSGEVDRAKEALELRQQIEAAEDPDEKRRLEQELLRLGFERGANEREIAQAILDRQEQRFRDEQAALQRSQQAAQRNLEFEIQRDRLTARRQVTEETIALARLRSQESEIRNELRLAQIRGDTQAVEIAQDAITDLQPELAAQQQLIDLAREELGLEEQRAQQRRDALAAAQQEEQIDLSRSQADTANQIARDLVGTAVGDDAQELANATDERADREQQLGERLADELETRAATDDVLASMQARTDDLLATQQRLTDEAQDYADALAAGTAQPGQLAQVPGFRSGGITPGGPAVVGEAGPELAFQPRGTRIVSNPTAKRWAQQAIAQNPQAYQKLLSRPMGIGGISTPPIPSKTSSPEQDFVRAASQLTGALNKFQPGQVIQTQQNRFSVSRETMRGALRDMQAEIIQGLDRGMKRQFGLS